MKKKDKMYDTTISLFTGIILIILGIILIIFNKNFYINVINILLIFILINSFLNIVRTLLNKKKNKQNNFIVVCLNTLFIIIILFVPSIPQSFFPILFSTYLILQSFIKLILFLISYKDYEHSKFSEIIYSIFYFVIGISIFLFPMKYIDVLLLILGIYFIVLGSLFELKAISVNIPNKYKNNIKRKIKIQLPVWIEAVVPYTVFVEINNLFEIEEEKSKITKDKLHKIKPDMEVLVHVSANGFNRIGHVDIVYNDKVISYGNYDDESHKLFDTMGEGVLFYVNKEKYIPFCIKHSKKIIFSFGIKLSKEQKKQIENKIFDIRSNCFEWNSPRDKKNINNLNYACELYKATKAKFYKFNSGKFKTYFVCGSSCCDLANEIIGSSGIDLLKMNGLISPGTYYDCLNREYVNRTGLVVSRKIYTKDTYSDLLNVNSDL